MTLIFYFRNYFICITISCVFAYIAIYQQCKYFYRDKNGNLTQIRLIFWLKNYFISLHSTPEKLFDIFFFACIAVYQQCKYIYRGKNGNLTQMHLLFCLKNCFIYLHSIITLGKGYFKSFVFAYRAVYQQFKYF